MPPTAIPGEIYDSLASHVRGGDRHSPYIKVNRVGILNGAESKAQAGVITDAQRGEITAIVAEAEVADFQPLLFVMPFRAVVKRAIVVPPQERAHPLSIEYRIEALPSYLFDVVDIEGSRV